MDSEPGGVSTPPEDPASRSLDPHRDPSRADAFASGGTIPRQPPVSASYPSARPGGDPPAATGDDGPAEDEAKKPGSFLRELPILILIAFGLALLIKTFFIQAFYIPSESMVPTLNVGDRVLVNKVIYHLRSPHRGEVIVFVGERFERGKRSFWQKVKDTLTGGLGGAQPAEKDYIKRIIGLPGETVEIKGGVVSITPKGGGKSFALDEPYIAPQRDLTPYGPFVVPDGQYFVLGDNRPNSSDSRSVLGPIKRKEIVGRAFVRIWPLSRFRFMRRPGYTSASAVVLLGFAAGRGRRRRRRASAPRAA